MKTIIGLLKDITVTFKYALILSVLLMASFDVEFKYELLHFLTMAVLAMTCNVFIWDGLEKFKYGSSFISDTIQAVNNPLVASVILFISFTHSWWFLLLFFAAHLSGQLFHFLLRGWVPWLYIFFLPYLLITSFIYSTNFFYLFLILLVPAYLFVYLYFKFFKKELLSSSSPFQPFITSEDFLSLRKRVGWVGTHNLYSKRLGDQSMDADQLFSNIRKVNQMCKETISQVLEGKIKLTKTYNSIEEYNSDMDSDLRICIYSDDKRWPCLPGTRLIAGFDASESRDKLGLDCPDCFNSYPSLDGEHIVFDELNNSGPLKVIKILTGK